MNIVENYLNKLRGEVIQEGLWAKIKKFFASGDPNDIHLDKALDRYHNDWTMCRKMFPHSGGSMKIPTGRNRDGDIENINISTYKENPKQIKCELEARYKFCKFVVEYIKKNGSAKICKRHKYPDKCETFIAGEFRDASKYLHMAKKELELIEKHGQHEKPAQWDVTIGRLKQLK